MKIAVALFTLCLSLLAGIPEWASAQNSRFELGIEGGIGTAGFTGNEAPDKQFKSVAGGYAGAQFTYRFYRYFSVKTELFYERKGSIYQLDTTDFESKWEYKLDYITHTAMLQMEFGNKVIFYLNLGPYISFLLGQNYSGKEIEVSEKNGLLISPASNHEDNRIDAGLVGEIGMKIPVHFDWLINFGVALHIGLVNTEKQPLFTDQALIPMNTDNTSFNRSILFSFGVSRFLAKTKTKKEHIGSP